MEYDIDNFLPLVVNVGLARHHADWNWKNVSSPFARLYYVMSGEAKIHIHHDTIQLRPECMYFIPSFVKHSYECTGDFTHYYIHIYENPQSDYLFLQNWTFPQQVQGGSLEKALFEKLCSQNPNMQLAHSDPSTYDNNLTLAHNVLLNKQRPLYNKMLSRGIIYQLLAPFFYEARPKFMVGDDRVVKIIDYIHNHLNQRLSVEELAGYLCVSAGYFTRLFKKEIGVVPMQYISERKVEKAQLWLMAANLPIKEIAMRLGYDDASYFNRVFKRTTGITPADYRKRMQTTL